MNKGVGQFRTALPPFYVFKLYYLSEMRRSVKKGIQGIQGAGTER